MTVHTIQIVRFQPLHAPLNRASDPFRRVIKLGVCDAAYFGEEEIGGARVEGGDGGVGQGAAEEFFRGTVVG